MYKAVTNDVTIKQVANKHLKKLGQKEKLASRLMFTTKM